MKIFDSIYKNKYEKLKKEFDSKVSKRANELYRERQDNWNIKEELYKQDIRFKSLEIRQKNIEIENLKKQIKRMENEKCWFEL